MTRVQINSTSVDLGTAQGLVNRARTRKSRLEGRLILGVNGRGDWIRTNDPHVPNVVLYQAELHPD